MRERERERKRGKRDEVREGFKGEQKKKLVGAILVVDSCDPECSLLMARCSCQCSSSMLHCSL